VLSWSAKWGLMGTDGKVSLQAEEDINKSQKERKKLTAHLHSVREEERNLIASELHDTVGQALTALKMDLFLLEKDLPQDQKNISDKMQSMNVLLDHTIQAIRKIYSELRPTLLELTGLEVAIEDHLDRFQDQTGIESDLEIKMEGFELEKNHSIALFRILQEALNNVKWHSKATHVRVGLVKNTNHLNMTIKDNGVGIRADKVADSTAFGLIGMKERAVFLGGELEIEGVPNKGTTIKMTIPLQP